MELILVSRTSINKHRIVCVTPKEDRNNPEGKVWQIHISVDGVRDGLLFGWKTEGERERALIDIATQLRG